MRWLDRMLVPPDAVAESTLAAQPLAGQRVDVIINARSGAIDNDGAAERVRERLRACGVDARVQVARTPVDLLAAASAAAAGDATVIVAGGGDGTIAAIAAGLLDTPKILGVLPLGTFNYFAQRIGIPLDLEAALDVLVTGTPASMTVGEVNGRVFLNNSSIGLYPAVLRRRETAYRRVG